MDLHKGCYVRKKDYPQTLQEYGFSLMGIPTCVVKLEFCENGFSPLCFLIWVVKAKSQNDDLHTLHSCIYSYGSLKQTSVKMMIHTFHLNMVCVLFSYWWLN